MLWFTANNSTWPRERRRSSLLWWWLSTGSDLFSFCAVVNVEGFVEVKQRQRQQACRAADTGGWTAPQLLWRYSEPAERKRVFCYHSKCSSVKCWSWAVALRAQRSCNLRKQANRQNSSKRTQRLHQSDNARAAFRNSKYRKRDFLYCVFSLCGVFFSEFCACVVKLVKLFPPFASVFLFACSIFKRVELPGPL